ncbi:hypothetical protein CCHL11_06077 [Colletotrichum chlorophyti]|uniref:Metallo-beta-lactamase domain-containing protein n=1 Tax=Colletotrichum chlorophyti TaxID=708187 RepID=A0A1Q8RWJ4_9PEZI|nr:hypothetical protein CCHL11_06077 [Colletotrichum chlorophyti]
MPAHENLNIPSSKSTVRVSIIDTTFDGHLPAANFMGPPMKGLEKWHAVGYAFLVTHEDSEGNQRRIIFDLGFPKDVENDFPPAVTERIKNVLGGGLSAKKYVSEILTENGVSLDDIKAIIWSHAHVDHVGRPSLFPKSTSLIVGPGVKTAFFPGYPAAENSQILAREFEEREVRELDFGGSDLRIGGLRALDFFGDGSFYLLSAPGHAVGHINALARTSEDSFIFFAGDSFHHGSVLRPHSGAPLPDQVRVPGLCCSGRTLHTIHPATASPETLGHYGKVFEQMGSDPDRVPFHVIPETPSGESLLAVDLHEARETVSAIQKFDSSPDVLVIAAHDAGLYDVLEYFPRDANDWKAKGWKGEGEWVFLQDFAKPLELAGTSVDSGTK